MDDMQDWDNTVQLILYLIAAGILVLVATIVVRSLQ
jgi:hypothetical protein